MPWQSFVLIFRRDLRIAFRRISEWANPLLFFVAVAGMFPLALSPDRLAMSPGEGALFGLQSLGIGVLWMAALLSSLMGLDRLFLSDVEDGSIAFVATDPPYNPQLKATMSGGKLSETFANRRTDYAMVTEDPDDLANSASYGEYLERMGSLFGELRRVLREKRYAVVIVRDAYQDGSYRFVASDLAARAAPHGLTAKGDLIWYQAGTRLRPYGYPHAFVPNIVHQHVLVLRNE